MLGWPNGNPFHASFGVSPPLLVGRDGVIDEFMEALDDGPEPSGRATLYTGARGSGKAMMLNAIEDRARERGWDSSGSLLPHVSSPATSTPQLIVRSCSPTL